MIRFSTASIAISPRNGVREYVHRVGRTGRAGRQGFAITLLEENDGDLRHCGDIVKVLKVGIHRIILDI